MYKKAILILAVYLTTVITSGVIAQEVDNGEIIRTENIEGIICTKYKDWNWVFPNIHEFWQPTKEEVLQGEAAIEKYLRSFATGSISKLVDKLPNYKRQYIGIIVEGHRRIFYNFFCRIPFGTGKLNQDPIFVKDGGDCFFQIQYDFQDGKCYKLSINGVA